MPEPMTTICECGHRQAVHSDDGSGDCWPWTTDCACDRFEPAEAGA